MLIVSKFHDYYDVGMKTGIDKTVVYERNTTSIEGTFPPPYKYKHTGWSCCVLAFCGKFYPFVYHVQENKIDRIIWTLDEALASLPLNKYRYWDEYSLETKEGITKFFGKTYPEMEEEFHKHKTPIFGFKPVLGRVYSWMKNQKYDVLVLNPCLKDIEFYKVKGPIEAYQEISMFVSGVIGTPAKPMVEVSDKVKAASRGHDGKYSFKKPPGKKTKWR